MNFTTSAEKVCFIKECWVGIECLVVRLLSLSHTHTHTHTPTDTLVHIRHADDLDGSSSSLDGLLYN